MKENEFRYLVIQSLIVLTHEVHRLAGDALHDTARKDLQDLAERLETAKEEAMK